MAATIPELTTYFLTVWEGNPGDKLENEFKLHKIGLHSFRSGTPIKMVRSAIAAGLYFDGDAPGSRTAADNVARWLQLFQNLLLIF